MEEQGNHNHSREAAKQGDRKWYSLIDKIWAKPNLEEAFKEVKRNRGAAGIDRMTIKAFETHTSCLHPESRRNAKTPRYSYRERPSGTSRGKTHNGAHL
ncbi:hypothetical protein [Paenibacillus chungangensis]|uniref:Group II intron reverse transcriptase/maturase n=1 Tax=Paenibacillus chungangensis TaxID=696535 RepID=A0ABW3HRH4_9BACL